DDSTQALRERLWHAVLTAYHESGQFDQVIEFNRIAFERWGQIQDPDTRAAVEWLVADSAGIVNAPSYANPSDANAPTIRLARNYAVFLNFKLNSAYPNVRI